MSPPKGKKGNADRSSPDEHWVPLQIKNAPFWSKKKKVAKAKPAKNIK